MMCEFSEGQFRNSMVFSGPVLLGKTNPALVLNDVCENQR